MIHETDGGRDWKGDEREGVVSPRDSFSTASRLFHKQEWVVTFFIFSESHSKQKHRSTEASISSHDLPNEPQQGPRGDTQQMQLQGRRLNGPKPMSSYQLADGDGKKRRQQRKRGQLKRSSGLILIYLSAFGTQSGCHIGPTYAKIYTCTLLIESLHWVESANAARGQRSPTKQQRPRCTCEAHAMM